MTVIITGKMLGGYQKPDFTNKDTGEVSKGKYVVQLMLASQLKNGELKQELYDISVPPERVKEYKGKEGQDVHIKCNYISKEKVTFYGI